MYFSWSLSPGFLRASALVGEDVFVHILATSQMTDWRILHKSFHIEYLELVESEFFV